MEIKNIVSKETFLKLAEEKVRGQLLLTKVRSLPCEDR